MLPRVAGRARRAVGPRALRNAICFEVSPMSEIAVAPCARVNSRSRFSAPRIPAFTLGLAASFAAAALAFAAPVAAQGNRVLVLAPLGQVSDDERDRVEDAIHEALIALHFTPMTEGVSLTPDEERAIPETANDMLALAEMQRCDWVLVPTIRPEEGGYLLNLRAGSRSLVRVESIDSEVRRSREPERLGELLRALLRPEGLGADAARLSGQDATARAAESAHVDEEARARAEAEARARAEAEAREREARSTRERYGRPDRKVVLGSIGGLAILNAPPNATGGGIGTVALRFGYAVAPGFELRAGLGGVFGAAGGVDVFAGGAYFASPFTHAKVHLGAILEVGLFGSVTGHRGAGFLLRVGPTIAWHATRSLWIEATVPSFELRTAGNAVALLGGELRLGTRF